MQIIRWGERRSVGVVLALACSVVVSLALATSARAADCSLADLSYNGACGSEFETPAWGDGGGWTDPSKYSTIQLADLTGNGIDELIGRNDDGIEIWRFDKTLGQWRPAIGANGQPEILTDFHSPAPSDAGPSWTQAQYYSTIQTTVLTPGGGEDIIARFPDGIRVYAYTPPAGTTNIDGGKWSLISSKGPFSDADGYTAPSLYLTIHVVSAQNGLPAQMLAQTSDGVVVYDWNGSGWTKVSPDPPLFYQPDAGQYLTLQWASLPGKVGVVHAVVEDTGGGGVSAQYETGGQWQALGLRPNPGIFGNNVPSVDCPVPDQCFQSSPSYYETLRFGDMVGDGDHGDPEALGRLSDGLRVWQLASDGSAWTRLATLTALGGTNPAPGQWASIRLGSVLGTKGQQVLALDGNGLQTWSYNSQSNSWTELAPSTPLNLGGDMWDNDASYYSTIRIGDVTGDGQEAVVARGPFGIRTWFYNLKGNSGWTSWLPQDSSSYPQFSGGQAAALAYLNTQANLPAGVSTVRAFLTQENAPSVDDLDSLMLGIPSFAGCAGSQPYAMCTPPNGSTGFTAADWTAVVNEVLDEIALTKRAVTFFTNLNALRKDTFLGQGFDLDSIAADLSVQGAEGNQTEVNPSEIAATALEILGALAAEVPVVGGPAGTSLDVAGSLVGLLASDSPTLNSQFPATYAALKDKFATMVSDVDKGLKVQSQEVRQSYGMLNLITQLTTNKGAWRNPDNIGIKSATDQGFALWVYQQLLPTLYARYQIDNCDWANHYPRPAQRCTLSGAGPETIGGEGDNAFTTIGLPPTQGGLFGPVDTPCNVHDQLQANDCTFVALPGDISTKVWGPLTDTCNYQPGAAATAWAFGACNVGVNKYSSVSLVDGTENGWDFPSYCLNFQTDFPQHPCIPATGSVTVGARGRVKLGGAIKLPRGFEIKGAAIGPDRLLHEPGGPNGGPTGVVGANPPLTLKVVHVAAHGGQDALASSAGRTAQLVLSPRAHGRQTYTLATNRTRVGSPAACQTLPASVALTTSRFVLTTTVTLTDGARKLRLALRHLWRCARNRAGAIRKLLLAPTSNLHRRSGLRMSLLGPPVVRAHSHVTYRVRLRNVRRRSGHPDVAALWHVVVHGAVVASRASHHTVIQRKWYVKKLRSATSKVLRLRLRVPPAWTGRLCVVVSAIADAAVLSSAHVCPRVTPRRGG